MTRKNREQLRAAARPLVVSTLKLALAVGVLLTVSGELPARAGVSGEAVLVIANRAFPASGLDLSDVRRIFEKRLTRLKGQKIAPLHARVKSSLRRDFSRQVLGRPVADDLAFWQAEQVRSGLRPPAELGDTVRAVFSVKTAVSYCYESQFHPELVKELYRTKPRSAAARTFLQPPVSF